MKLLRSYLRFTLHEELSEQMVEVLEDSLNPEDGLVLDDETSLSFRWSRPPELLAGEGVRIWLDVRVEGPPYDVESLAVPGWPVTERRAPVPAPDHTAGIGIAPDVINCLLHRAWARGRLDDWLEESRVVSDFNDANLLRVRISGARVALPPVLDGPAATTSLAFGLEDGSRSLDATSTLALRLAASWHDRSLAVDAAVEGFHLYCSEDRSLVTCYSDLLQIARDQRMLDGSVGHLLALDLARFSRALLYSGERSELRLRVDDMSVDLGCGGVCADVAASF
jgi:hypothetical protein